MQIFQFKNLFTRKSRRKQVLVTGLAIAALVVLVTLAAVNANATPISPAEVRLAGWVDELKADKLTAARQDAQRNLELAGESAVPRLLTALRSDSQAQRRNAADILGYIASPLATDALLNTLRNDPVPAVRRNAAWALGEIDSFAALGDLQRSAILDGNKLVRQTAQDSIARIRTRLALASSISETALNSFAVAPQNPQIIYATTRRDLVVTRDGGKNWQTLKQALPGLTTTLATSPANSQVLYAGVDGSGMYKSTDGGRSWNAINYGLPITSGARFVVTAVTVDPTEPQRLVIATGIMLGTSTIGFHPTGIFLSNNGGTDWILMQQYDKGEPLTRLALVGNQLYGLGGDTVLRFQFD
jgi:hypothetical protein